MIRAASDTPGLILLLSLLLVNTIAASNCLAKTSSNGTDSSIDKTPKGHWVVDPRQPEASLPPVGRSLFDFIFTETKNGTVSYNIPFPYSELINKIESLVQSNHLYKSSVKQVLVPLGRSLARNIARPDFFLYPRVVSVVDTEPKAKNKDSGMMLKDRLYIGYGEAAQILEIISYNEAAGRFEFQIVTDYKAGVTPKVFYANREVCQACHQNAALIFSRQQWDETNSNPRIAALLKERKEEFYGISVDKGVDIPFAIDSATDRANLFSLYQLLWQKGCDTANGSTHQNQQDAIQCRSNLLIFILQYLLSNNSVFDYQSEYYKNKFLPSLKASWKQHWPEGLLIPDPDIPNRDPLLITTNNHTVEKVVGDFSEQASSTLNTMLSKNDVSEKFEPLNYRPPLENWNTQSANLDKKLVAGLASFIPTTDILRLDQQLKTIESVQTQKIYLNCLVDDNRTSAQKRRVKFSCESPNTSDNAKTSLKGRFFLVGDKWQSGKLSRLIIDGQTQFDLVLKGNTNKNNSEKYNARLQLYTSNNFSQNDNLLTARTPGGNAIDKFSLSWRKGTTGEYSAELVIRNDFDSVKASIDKLAKMTAGNESDAFSDKPFRRTALMKFILGDIGAPTSDWCCVDDSGLPEARLQDPDNKVDIVSQAANPEIAPFYHYCATCHRTSNKQPPNFLQGDEKQVEQKISQCAERIYFRLSMWHQNTQDRAKSPMPPVTALHNLGFTQSRWATSDELLSLKHAVEKLITVKTGKQPDIKQLIKTGFGGLPECLAGT